MRDRTEDKIILVMIRHGETRSNRERRYLGRTEESLSERGKEDLTRYQRSGYYPEVDALFVSPMERCLQTAEILYPQITPICIADWTEMDFGAFERKNFEELRGDKRYQEWIDSGGRLPFPEGESREEFVLRCERGFLKMEERIDSMGRALRTIGLIVHGGTIMALLSLHLGGEYFDYQTVNGGGYLCTCLRRSNGLQFTEVKKI